MKIETFEMERTQCLFEKKVELNLSESGVLPGRLLKNPLFITFCFLLMLLWPNMVYSQFFL